MEEITTCEIHGHAEVYGLGIRLGFYLQWFSVILASWLAPAEVHSIRHTNAALLLATLISVVALRDTLAVPESYITLMFLYGSTLYVLPKIVLRWLASTFPGRAFPVYSTAPPRRKGFGFLWSLLMLAELFFSLWYMFSQVATLEGREGGERCARYGFLLAKMPLDSWGLLHTFQGVLGFLMIGAVILLIKQDLEASSSRGVRFEADYRFKMFRLLETFTELYVAVVITIGIEVTIMWNDIRGVYSVNTTGQLIPLLYGINAVLRIIYTFWDGADGIPFNRPIVYSRLPEYEDAPDAR